MKPSFPVLVYVSTDENSAGPYPAQFTALWHTGIYFIYFFIFYFFFGAGALRHRIQFSLSDWFSPCKGRMRAADLTDRIQLGSINGISFILDDVDTGVRNAWLRVM